MSTREAATVFQGVTEDDQLLAGIAYGVAMKRLRDHQAAEEVTQDTMVAYKARHEPPDNAEAWITTVATNLAADEWRRRQKQQSLIERLNVGWTVHAQHDDDEILARLVLREAVSSLSRRQREAVTYVLIDGLDRSAAAAKMGIGLESLKTYLKRGKGALRAFFGPEEGSQDNRW
jgi:RNA polymerase sigma-70 factor (ECF subfamily)